MSRAEAVGNSGKFYKAMVGITRLFPQITSKAESAEMTKFLRQGTLTDVIDLPCYASIVQGQIHRKFCGYLATV